ncbi:S-layer homology domain-containing protein [Bacillus sp. AFS015802]|uniref:S-layer homology domain-containing protein n=1 Tax=Bacillus sp. AFS015802 TaxID=2033486 RepID=UPI001156061B|nr:S-layer homology domain-containing protein [Bacillus sp. AFS015802]
MENGIKRNILFQFTIYLHNGGAKMKKFITCLPALLVTLLLLTPATYAATFNDINEGQRFYTEITYLLDKDIITGYKDGTFRPQEKVTRAAAAAMIGRALKFDGEQREAPFPDVSRESYASGYIAEAVNKGVIKGFPDGMFRPDAIVTRGQMAIIIARAFHLEISKDILFYDISPNMNAFSSIGKIVAAGITQGYDDGTFRPEEELSREQFSAFLARALAGKFKVTMPVVKPVQINYHIIGEGIESNHHNGKLFVLKPFQFISLNKLTHEKDRVIVNNDVLRFENEQTIVPIKTGIGSITIIPGENDRKKAYTYKVLIGAKEDISASILNKHFMDLANNGYLNGCEFSVDDVQSRDVMNYYPFDPEWKGYYEGGYGRDFNGCTYFGGDSNIDSPIGAIIMDGGKIGKTPAEIKDRIGNPLSQGYSEADDSWLMYYRLEAGYELYFSFQSPTSKLNHLLYKDKAL